MLPLQACAQLMQTFMARIGLYIMNFEPTNCRSDFKDFLLASRKDDGGIEAVQDTVR